MEWIWRSTQSYLIKAISERCEKKSQITRIPKIAIQVFVLFAQSVVGFLLELLQHVEAEFYFLESL